MYDLTFICLHRRNSFSKNFSKFSTFNFIKSRCVIWLRLTSGIRLINCKTDLLKSKADAFAWDCAKFLPRLFARRNNGHVAVLLSTLWNGTNNWFTENYTFFRQKLCFYFFFCLYLCVYGDCMHVCLTQPFLLHDVFLNS